MRTDYYNDPFGIGATRRGPSSALIVDDPNEPPIIPEEHPDPPSGPMGTGGGTPGQAGGSGGAGPGSVPPSPAAPPPPPNVLPSGQASNLFLGNYVPLSNYLYANQGRQFDGGLAAPAPATGTGGVGAPVGSVGGAAPVSGALGAYGLDQALAQQSVPPAVAATPPDNGGGTGTDGTGGTGSGGPPGPPRRGPNEPQTPLTMAMPPRQPVRQPYDMGVHLRDYLYHSQRT